MKNQIQKMYKANLEILLQCCPSCISADASIHQSIFLWVVLFTFCSVHVGEKFSVFSTAGTSIHLKPNRATERNRLSSVSRGVFIALSSRVPGSFSRLEQSVQHERDRLLISNYN